jgi:cytochrome c551/c552
MPVPLIGAAAAASLVGRLAARSAIDKVAIKAITSSRGSGGITGPASKFVNPMYKEMDSAAKVAQRSQLAAKVAKKSQAKNKSK